VKLDSQLLGSLVCLDLELRVRERALFTWLLFGVRPVLSFAGQGHYVETVPTSSLLQRRGRRLP
jgi:hypothetical protein